MWPWAAITPLILFALLVDANPCALPQIACAARLSAYPRAEPDGSGWESSGLDDVPIYDEFFLPISPFDFSASPSISEHNICSCGADVGNCSFADPDRVIRLDRMVELAFCGRTEEIFKSPCRGRRGIIRVIGRIHESGEALISIDESVMFCKCERGYHRIRVEPWMNDLYAFIYKCVWKAGLRSGPRAPLLL